MCPGQCFVANQNEVGQIKNLDSILYSFIGTHAHVMPMSQYYPFFGGYFPPPPDPRDPHPHGDANLFKKIFMNHEYNQGLSCNE